jgi:uncharacterized protein (DUF2235 family)
VPVDLLRLFDTVKSYGGPIPRKLLHLRHNPDVTRVRHALALDERYGWFLPTTWGWLDNDQGENAAASRLDDDTRRLLTARDVAEAWFAGTHDDIGAGDINTAVDARRERKRRRGAEAVI